MSFINKILKPGASSGWSAIDIGPEGLVGASVVPPREVGARPLVAACGEIEAAELSPEALTSLSRKMGAGHEAWTIPLDRKLYNIFVIEEPQVQPQEMEQSVRWTISTMIDYPVTEASVTWMRIPTEKLLPNRPPHIYVVAAQRLMVEELRLQFKQAKLNLGAIDVRETAHRNIASLVAKPGEGLALLSVGKRGVQLTITFQGELYLDRHVDEAVFAQAADEAVLERARERVVLQVQRSLDFVGRTLPFIDINRVILAPMPGETVLRDRIAENLPVPVESLDLNSIFDLSRVPGLSQEAEQAKYFVALGAALRFMEGAA